MPSFQRLAWLPCAYFSSWGLMWYTLRGKRVVGSLWAMQALKKRPNIWPNISTKFFKATTT